VDVRGHVMPLEEQMSSLLMAQVAMNLRTNFYLLKSRTHLTDLSAKPTFVTISLFPIHLH
jgi:hypothetical protein